MTNIEKLNDLYDEKRRNGLTHVSFSMSPSAATATPDEIAQEILNIEEAIAAGKSTALVFDDRHTAK